MMRPRKYSSSSTFVAMLLLLFTATTCFAAEGLLPVPDYSGDLLERTYLTLQERAYTSPIWYNP